MGHERAIANGVFHLISSAMFHRPHLPKTVDVARLIAANTRCLLMMLLLTLHNQVGRSSEESVIHLFTVLIAGLGILAAHILNVLTCYALCVYPGTPLEICGHHQ